MSTKLRLLLFLVATGVASVSVVDLQASRGYSTEWYFMDGEEFVGEGYTECNWQFTMWWGYQTGDYSGYDTTCGGGSAGQLQICPGGCAWPYRCYWNGCQMPPCWPNCP